MTKKSANEVMPVRSSTVRPVAFLDSAARTAISQEGEPVWSAEFSCGSALVRRYSCPYRTTARSATQAETTHIHVVHMLRHGVRRGFGVPLFRTGAPFLATQAQGMQFTRSLNTPYAVCSTPGFSETVPK